MMNQGLQAFRGKRVLLLQGPVGPFFTNLALDLRGAGAQVFKVNFNGGDWWFSPPEHFSRVFNFRAGVADWPRHFRILAQRLGIDIVMLFGDCRPVHAAIVGVCDELGIERAVFEEGYLRPDHITLERGGVNSHSLMPNDPKVFMPYRDMVQPATQALGSTFGAAARWAMAYYFVASLLKPVFWRYRHHRQLGILDGLHWIRSYWRKRRYSKPDALAAQALCERHDREFFLVALQLSADAQVIVHSDYERIEDFIVEVAESFATHAAPNQLLVFKHHPLDRGYSDYSGVIRSLASRLGIGGRCLYVHDPHLPTLLRHALGVVTINSTAGLSALEHGCAVKSCGRAIYDMQGLTFQGSLDEFWTFAHLNPPQKDLLRGFRNYLLTHNQHNGSFYKKLPGQPLRSGVLWHKEGDASLDSAGASIQARPAVVGHGARPSASFDGRDNPAADEGIPRHGR
jgi:capsular polysaccharide export protein